MGFIDIISSLLMLGLVAFIAFIVNLIMRARSSPEHDKMSFREAMDLVSLPIVTFKQGDIKLNFLLDTGASFSVINEGSLEGIVYSKTNMEGYLYGIEGNKTKCSYVDLNLSYKDKHYRESFQVADLSVSFGNIKESSGVVLHGILGSSFFEKYKYILDFQELVAYSKL